MIRGFALHEDGSVEQIDSVDAITSLVERKPREFWVDLEAPDHDLLTSVGRSFKLDPEAVEDCLTGEQRPRIDEFDDYFFVVSYGAVGPKSSETFAPRKISAFVGNDLLITVHREPLRTINDVHQRCSKGPKRMMERGSDYLFYAIIDGMVDNYIHVAEGFDRRLDQLEEACFSPDADESVLHGASQLRREVLELRRIAGSQREMISPIAQGEFAFISESLERDFRHVVDHLTKTIEVIDNLRELLHGVRDNYQAVLGNRMNSVMKTLTIFASLFLPLSLIAGVYGMNTPLWPNPDSWNTFALIMGAMGLTAGIMISFFWYRRWF